MITNLQAHVTYLADDKLEGRRAGTNGEKLAREYISKRISKSRPLNRKAEHRLAASHLKYMMANRSTLLHCCRINDHELKLNDEYFPFVVCPTRKPEAAVSPRCKRKRRSLVR